MVKPDAASQQTRTARIAEVCRNSSLLLAACLVFLVPFDVARNIDLQSLLLLVSGGFAWIAIALGRWKLLLSLDLSSKILLGIFGASCLVSFLINPNFGYDLIGAPYIRLGIGAWWACLGIGLLCRTIRRHQLLRSLYILITGLAVASVPYILLRVYSLPRAGGIIEQADILACFLGCGLLLGWEMLRVYPKWRPVIVAVQILMGVMLLATQTRAAILLVIVLSLVWVFQYHRGQTFKVSLVCVAAIIAVFAAWNLAPARVTNTAYASRSVHYRLTLQNYALRATFDKPVFGYGPGNLADALYCPQLLDKALQTTCDEGYFFNSSHNIFIDRVLGIGWPGALAFLGLTLAAIYRSLRGKRERRVLGYALLLISAYYLTNVTSVTLELLFWILLIQCLVVPGVPKQSHD